VETRAKISAVQKGTNNSMFGKTHNEETSAKISASKIGNSNGKNQPNAQIIQVTDLELVTKTLYNSMNDGARALNIDARIISTYFSRNQIKPYKGRYVFTRK
jgi:hypothetical protein